MSEPLLNVMKIMLLAGLYLFFVRVLWSVFSELRDPRTVARKAKRGPAAAPGPVKTTTRGPVPAPVAGGPVPAYAPAPGGVATAAAVGQLVVVEPPQLAGLAYALGREITIGRAPTNGIILDDTYVSTVHGRIFATNGTYFFEDLASRNGSSLNGLPVVETTPLSPGDRLQLGSTALEFA